MTEEEILEIGTVKHFFTKISVAIVDLTAPLSVGDQILIKGPSTDFEMKVDSMQVEHKDIQCAEPGDCIGLKTAQLAKERDVVYKKL
jgi:putative protease